MHSPPGKGQFALSPRLPMHPARQGSSVTRVITHAVARSCDAASGRSALAQPLAHRCPSQAQVPGALAAPGPPALSVQNSQPSNPVAYDPTFPVADDVRRLICFSLSSLLPRRLLPPSARPAEDHRPAWQRPRPAEDQRTETCASRYSLTRSAPGRDASDAAARSLRGSTRTGGSTRLAPTETK